MSLRGTNTLFKDIYELPLPEKQRKGRSESLINLRNDCLVDRYYFIAKTTGLRYELVIGILSKEFFLSEVTIPEILDDNYYKIAAVKKAAPTKKELEKKWSHLNWAAPVIPFEN